MAKYPPDLLKLVAFLRKLPGVGSKTAERFAFHILTWPQELLDDFSSHAASIKQKIQHCLECHCLMEEQYCPFCDKDKRDTSLLCILSSAKDVYALEETRSYRGLYHIIGGLLSPLDGRSPEYLGLDKLRKRLQSLQIKEVILALDSTFEGDATSLYLKEQLNLWGISVSRLALGLPMGSTLDFVDGGTLSKALLGRHTF